jgi:hypothetical protein
MNPRSSFYAIPISWLFVLPSAVTGQEWSHAEFAKLKESVCQAPDATWRTIPWETDLLEAQRIAVREKKPIFIWAMDGHPLCCT